MKIHIVQKGDTLYKIAQKYDVDFTELKKLNNHLSNPEMIMPGMKIKVPSGEVPVKKQVKKEAPKAKQQLPKAETKPVPKPEAKPPKVEHPYKDTTPKPQPVMETEEESIDFVYNDGPDINVIYQDGTDVQQQLHSYNMNVPPFPSPPKGKQLPGVMEEEVEEPSPKQKYPIYPPKTPKAHYAPPKLPKAPCGCNQPKPPMMPYGYPAYPPQGGQLPAQPSGGYPNTPTHGQPYGAFPGYPGQAGGYPGGKPGFDPKEDDFEPEKYEKFPGLDENVEPNVSEGYKPKGYSPYPSKPTGQSGYPSYQYGFPQQSGYPGYQQPAGQYPGYPGYQQPAGYQSGFPGGYQQPMGQQSGYPGYQPGFSGYAPQNQPAYGPYQTPPQPYGPYGYPSRGSNDNRNYNQMPEYDDESK